MIGPQIPAAAQRHTAAKQPPAPRWDVTDKANGDSFSELLTQLTGQTRADRATAASVRPDIGSHAQAFAASPLLVRTALSAPVANATPDALIIEPTAVKALPVERQAILPDTLQQALETMLSDAASPHGHAISSTRSMAATASSRASVAAHRSLPVTTSPALLPPVMPRLSPGPVRNETRDTTAATRTASHISRGQHGQGGSWTFHYLPVEGGYRLLVKLIRLPDDLRGELEGRLRDLFREFGLNLRDLDLRETGTGGN